MSYEVFFVNRTGTILPKFSVQPVPKPGDKDAYAIKQTDSWQSLGRSHFLPDGSRGRGTQLLISQIPKDGGSRTDLPRSLQLSCHKRCDGFKDVYGRMKWGDIAPTLTTGCFNPSKGRFLHPEENRTITIREAALLQTFPRCYKLPAKLGKVALALQIGNALPPEFVRRHAEAVKMYLEANL